jgi:hypothetical protein
MIANEIVHGVKKKGIHGFMLKVDFHKAFDSVLRDYLEEVMNYIYELWEKMEITNP